MKLRKMGSGPYLPLHENIAFVRVDKGGEVKRSTESRAVPGWKNL
jgi:hypothetical protein